MGWEILDGPEWVGLALGIGVLADAKVQEFVSRIREQEELGEVVCGDDLELNLERHGLDDFIKKSLPIADEYLGRSVFGEMAAGETEEAEVLTPEACEQDWREIVEGAGLSAEMEAGMRVGMESVLGKAEGGPLWGIIELFMRMLRAEAAVPVLARTISHFIVGGYLEIPKPVPTTGMVVGPLVFPGGDWYLAALIAPWAPRREVGQWIGAVLPKVGKRERVPDKLEETLWMRFYMQQMAGEAGEEAWDYRSAAELSFEIWPKTRPKNRQGQAWLPGDKPYEKAVARVSNRIQKNSKKWEEWREVYLRDAET